MKKKVKQSIFILMLEALFCVGCSKTLTTEASVSHAVKTVIETIMTCPNPDLCNSDMILEIGLDTEPSEEEKARAEAANEAAMEKWEEAIGEYFIPKELATFLSTGGGMSYLSYAEFFGNEISVKSMTLEEQTNTTEKVNVILLVNHEEEQQAEVEFWYDNEGLIRRVLLSGYMGEAVSD